MQNLTTKLLFAAALAAPALPGQTLLALEDGNIGGAKIHEISLTGQILSTCTLPAQVGFIPMGPTLGDLTYSRGGVISTDGLVVAETDLQCNVKCQTGGFGLLQAVAADDAGGMLYFANNNMIGAYWMGCPQPTQLHWACNLPAPLQAPLVGMEWDSQAGTLWVVDAGGIIAELSLQQVPSWSCTVLRAFPVMTPPGQLAAMPESIAVNPCTQQIFMPDAVGNIIVMSTNGAPQGVMQVQGLQPGAFLVGLTRRPAQPVNLGGGCIGAGCPACAVPQAFTTGGDPILGNGNFRIDVQGAPFDANGGSIALLAIDFAPGAMNVGLCQPLQIAGTPNAVLLNAGIVGAGPGNFPCNGIAWRGLPIPNLPQLCGVTVYAQWGLLCTATGGISLSNALAIPIN